MYWRSRDARALLLLLCLVIGVGILAVSSQALAQDNAGHDHHFFIQSDDGNFRMEFAGRLQTQYELAFDHSGEATDLALSRFYIRRARLKLEGHVFSPRLTYVFQPDFGKGEVELLDYFLNYALVPDTFEAKVGQMRLPFLRQEITSSGHLLLVDRSLVTKVFGEGYDVGVAVHDHYTKSPTFEWVAGIYNGTASNLGVVPYKGSATEPEIFFPSVVARVAYNYGGIAGYSEGDLHRGGLGFSIGASGLAQLGIDRDNQSALKTTVDYVVKVHGFSSSGAFMIASAQDGPSLVGDQTHIATGFYAQAGYLIGEMIQPALRYSLVDLTGDNVTDHEALGGLNVYFHGHNLKWQTDAGALIHETPQQTDTEYRLRTQLQLAY